MAQVNLSTDEARVISVFRAINDFGQNALVDVSDLGDVVAAIEQVTDLEKLEKDLSASELKQYISGFVAGMGSIRIPELRALQDQLALYEQENQPASEGHFVGGPTGGTALQQGEDPNFVTQSGVHDNK